MLGGDFSGWMPTCPTSCSQRAPCIKVNKAPWEMHANWEKKVASNVGTCRQPLRFLFCFKASGGNTTGSVPPPSRHVSVVTFDCFLFKLQRPYPQMGALSTPFLKNQCVKCFEKAKHASTRKRPKKLDPVSEHQQVWLLRFTSSENYTTSADIGGVSWYFFGVSAVCICSLNWWPAVFWGDAVFAPWHTTSHFARLRMMFVNSSCTLSWVGKFTWRGSPKRILAIPNLLIARQNNPWAPYSQSQTSQCTVSALQCDGSQTTSFRWHACVLLCCMGPEEGAREAPLSHPTSVAATTGLSPPSCLQTVPTWRASVSAVPPKI